MAPIIKFIASPNFKDGNDPKLIVLHFTAGGIDGSVETFMKPNGLSSHYLVSKKGEIIQMVKESQIAFHAGKSFWGDLTNLNSYSIGIELEGWGKLILGSDHILKRWTGNEHIGSYHYINKSYWDHYPFLQIAKLVELCKDVMARYPNLEIVRHSDIAPGRKSDPGPSFPFNDFLLELSS